MARLQREPLGETLQGGAVILQGGRPDESVATVTGSPSNIRWSRQNLNHWNH